MKNCIVTEILTIVYLLVWLQPVVGGPLRCSLTRNFVRYFPNDPGAKEECRPCPDCPEGQGLSPQCGSKISNETKIECKQCQVNKTYSNSHGIQSCLPCNECGLKNVLQPCTQYQNRICGKDCPEGYFLNDNEDCQPEATSKPTATKSTIPNDPADINMTVAQMKTQVYNVTATSAIEISSVGGTTAPSILDNEEMVTPTANDSTNATTPQKEKGQKYQAAFIAVMSILSFAVIAAAVVKICRAIRSRTESAESGGGESIPLSRHDVEDSDSSTPQDIWDKEDAKPNIEQIPTDCSVSDMELLCDHDNQLMLFYLRRELDPIETATKKTWWSVGLALKVSPTDLELMKIDYIARGSPTESLIRKLKTFSKEPTIREFVQALVICGRNDVANYICNWPWEKLHQTA